LKKKGEIIENSLEYLFLIKSFFQGKKLPLKCAAAYTHIIIDAYYRIFPCFSWLEMGRGYVLWKGKPIREIFDSIEYQDIVEQALQCRDCYWNCHQELSLLFNPFFNYENIK